MATAAQSVRQAAKSRTAKRPERRRKRIELSEEDQEFLNVIRARFHAHAGGGRRLAVNQVKRLLGIRNPYLARRLFELLDDDRDGKVSEADFLKAVVGLILGTEEDKLRFVFRLHDADRDEAIDRDELDRMLAACLRHNRLSVSTEERRAIRDAIVGKAGDQGQKIDFQAFRRLLARVPLVRRQMLQETAAWFGAASHQPVDVKHLRFSTVLRHLLLVAPYYLWRALLVAAYVVANGYFFWEAMTRYAASGANAYIQIARGAGACVNFNGMLILIPMLRTLLTWVRKSFLFALFPVDQNVGFHKVVGTVMFVFALVHSAAHLLNYSTLDVPVARSLFHTPAGLSGVILLAVFAVIVLFALPFVRRTRFYPLFAASHGLYWAWFGLALFHAHSFIRWAGVPMAGFLVELLIRHLVKRRISFVKTATAHPSGVTRLELHRPPDMEFDAGEYIFLKIPQVSRFGWHPFTISSNPEERSHMGVHVRALGNWSRRLHGMIGGTPRAERSLPALFHGPYGSPATRIFSSRYAVLIGAGIGVTPFASILRSILHRHEHGEKMRLEKVYFFWLYRGQKTFQWFSELLQDLEARGTRSLLDINIYMTDTALNATTGLLKIGMELLRKDTDRDVLTGLHSQTHFGRPDWSQIFDRISREHPDARWNVFFCGPYPLGRVIRRASRRAGFHFRMEQF